MQRAQQFYEKAIKLSPEHVKAAKALAELTAKRP